MKSPWARPSPFRGGGSGRRGHEGYGAEGATPGSVRRTEKRGSVAFLVPIEPCRFFGRGHDPTYHGRAESLVLHPVEPGDRAAARRRHEVDFVLGVFRTLEKQGCRSAGGLRADEERLVR